MFGIRAASAHYSNKGSYASWFTTLAADSREPLLTVLNYVAPALSEVSLCLPAANALRDLCDANRAALAPHITAFGELHAGLSSVQDTEKAKVLQSISSVIQALPPDEEIPPIEVCSDSLFLCACTRIEHRILGDRTTGGGETVPGIAVLFTSCVTFVCANVSS